MTSKILKVLIVEDSPDRQAIFRNLFKDHAWMMVHTATRAIRLINSYDFDLICLDFDLAGDEQGDWVAKQIPASRNAETKVLVHSMNQPGANQIISLIPHALAIPISKITRDNKTFKRLKEELNRGIDIDWSYVFRRSD